MVPSRVTAVVPEELLQPVINKINQLSRSRQHAHWYMLRVEEYLSAVPRRSVSLHGADEVTQWLSELGRKTKLSEWQFRQCVEAAGILMRASGAAAMEYGWPAGGRRRKRAGLQPDATRLAWPGT